VVPQTRFNRGDNANKRPEYPRSPQRLQDTTRYKMSSIRRSHNHSWAGNNALWYTNRVARLTCQALSPILRMSHFCRYIGSCSLCYALYFNHFCSLLSALWSAFSDPFLR